ncbi:MAG: hypothetical protein WDZ49_04555 [Litorilinea sp.]
MARAHRHERTFANLTPWNIRELWGEPVVDHSVARQRTLEAYQAARTTE